MHSCATTIKWSKNWVEKGLPKLVDDIMVNYQTFGGMDHLEGRDLPSKKTVIEVLEDLFTILFPGYLGKAEITKANIKYHLGSTLTSVYTRLTDEVQKKPKIYLQKSQRVPTGRMPKKSPHRS